jgi:glycosyltransferase involved in cell wall biosynthesis
MSLPSISIVTPSLNQGRFIRRTITSVLDQGYPNLEYLIMDGESDDDSCAIAAEFVPRVTLVRERDQGQANAINKGFSRTSGEILAWLNSDDYYAPATLAKVAEVFATRPDVHLVYGDVEWVTEEEQPLASVVTVEPFNLDRLLSVGCFVSQPAAFFRRSAFEAVGKLREDLHWCIDYDLWIRLGKRFQALYIPEKLAFYRWYAESKTASGGSPRYAEVEHMIISHGGAGLPAFYRLEAAAQDVKDAFRLAKQRRFGQTCRLAVTALGRVALSPRAIKALASPYTWRVIRTARRRDALTLARGSRAR